MDVVKNFAKVVVSAGYAAGAASITLSTGHGAKLPDPAADGAFNLVWWNVTDYPDPTDDITTEIVRCTARTGDVLTVTRAQESTADADHNTATKTYQMILSPYFRSGGCIIMGRFWLMMSISSMRWKRI